MTDSGDNTLIERPPAADHDAFDIQQLTMPRAGAIDTPAPVIKRTLIDTLRRYRWGLIVVGIAAAAILAGFGMRPSTVQTTAVTLAYPSQQYVLVNATGYVVPQLKAAVASKATGRLEWLGVSEGNFVTKDQVLARMESRDVQSQSENAKANVEVARAAVETALAELANANSTANRFVDLKKQSYVSASMLEDALARTRKARANVESARASLGAAQATAEHASIAVDYTEIRAPFDGVILSRSANIGDIVTPMSSAADSKGAVVTMADMTTLQVETDVSESSLAKIKVDQPCEIMLDSIPNKRFRGIVRTIVPTIDRSKATVTTKIGFVDNDPRILPEMSARVSFLSKVLDAQAQKPVTALDPAAIVTRDGKQFAFAVWQDKVVEVEITPGEMLGDLRSIQSVLKAGDIVVAHPNSGLRNGERITISDKG